MEPMVWILGAVGAFACFALFVWVAERMVRDLERTPDALKAFEAGAWLGLAVACFITAGVLGMVGVLL